MLAAWALVAVPAFFFAMLADTDRLDARRYPWASMVLPPWFWLAAYFVLLGSGALAIAGLPLRRRWLRLCLAIVYIAAIGFALLFLGSSVGISGYHHSG